MPPSRRLLASLYGLAAAVALTAFATTAKAQGADGLMLEARDAQRKRDRVRLVALRDAAQLTKHPLASWVDYWELNGRLNEAQQPELDAFYARWPGSYVEDRLRNDWLLELGRRRDWANFTREFPRFRMNDDRQVTCYALLTAHLAGQTVRDAALPAWLAQRDMDDGCALMASTLYEAKVFTKDDVWRRIRQAAENNRPAVARHAATLVSPQLATAVAEAFGQPAKPLARKSVVMTHDTAEVTAVALARIAADDPDNATALLRARWAKLLPQGPGGWAWSQVGRSYAQKLQADAVTAYTEAFAQREQKPNASDSQWTDDTLAWAVRSALRFPAAERWALAARAIEEMSAEEQQDAGWQYWKARALRETAVEGPRGDAQRREAEAALQAIAATPHAALHFYGQLATEELGRTMALPPAPAPLTAEERAAARANPGLQRGLQLIALTLRGEGVREWNFTLRGMSDRELMAAAQWACEREVWDRCINSSERTKNEIDLNQRYPMPLRQHVVAAAGSVSLDPAYVYGLIRQESRFIMDARSGVGASGLMQLMPATAKWTAKKIGLDYTHDLITDRDTNLRLGTTYLKLALDDFGGSQAMAAAAYNAGPGRPRRWREGATTEAAAWAENIPFAETRDYVKKVLSNATVYSAMLTNKPPALKPRLGGPIGPRSPIVNDRDLP